MATKPLTTSAGSKTDWVVTDCLYRIATGVWPPGHRLPALRAAAELWSVNELTCLRAYRRLMALGLVQSRERTGYFVADSTPVTRLTRHQADLHTLYEQFEKQVRERTGLSVLAAARAVAQLADIHATRHPECAFVECTRFQAEGHAREVSATLRVPCLGLTTTELDRNPPPALGHVRTWLTTHFHLRELQVFHDPPRRTVAAVPIELAPSFIADLKEARFKEAVVLALAGPLARSIAGDLAARVQRKDLRLRSRGTPVAKLDAALEELLGAAPQTRRQVILSTGLWTAAAPRWKERMDVRPFGYQIPVSAWPDIADAVGVPYGIALPAGAGEGQQHEEATVPKELMAEHALNASANAG